MLKRIACVCLCAVMLFSFAGCGSTVSLKKYVVPENLAVPETGVVAENDRYSLLWDSEACVMLCDKSSGQVLWSTTPYSIFESGKSSSSASSPVLVQYYNPSDGSLESAKAYSECISSGLFSAEKTENGLKMQLFFEDAQITIPLYFTLREDSLEVSIPAAEIEESGKTKLIEVSVLPYLCSTPNTKDRDHYLFFPSGCGALAYTDEDVSSISRTYEADVYGVDSGRKLLDATHDSETVRMPVYGAKQGENALFAIIESGDGAAKITADAGNYKNEHSTVYATFQVRSYDETETARNDYSDERIYAADFDKDLIYKIGFYPLFGQDADYVGMARCYQKYLALDAAEKERQAPYRLQFFGGDMTRHFVMGVPYEALTVSTDFDATLKMIKELEKETGHGGSVSLQGFGKSGNTFGKLAGGYAFASAFGGMKGYQKVADYCKQNHIPLFSSFDLMRFGSSASGSSTVFDVAKTASQQKSISYPLSLNLRFPDEDAQKACFIKREKLDGAAQKLISFTDKTVGGIQLDSFGDVLYSDYSSPRYYSKGDTAQMTKIISKIKKSGHTVSVTGANAYAAVTADVINGVSLQNSCSFVFDETVPFYQLVFGSKAMYSETLNTVTNQQDFLLRAVEMGVSPSFSLCDQYDEKLETASNGVYKFSLYKGQKKQVVDAIESTADFYQSIENASLISHTLLEGGATVSEFSNGVTVVVNRTKKAVQYKDITVEPNSFRCFDGKEASK